MLQLMPKTLKTFDALANAREPFNSSPEFAACAEVFNAREPIVVAWHKSLEYRKAKECWRDRLIKTYLDLAKAAAALEKQEDKEMALAAHAAVDPSFELPC